jgi:NhaP-type Na+/H+ or K+/H+ antiporter/CBS domain-containing protein
MAVNLAELILLGLLVDYLFRRIRVPGLVGMLCTGILIGPFVLGLLKPGLLSVSSDLRMIALIVILLRAGFELGKDTLRRVGLQAVLLSCIPAILEALAVMLLGPRLLGLSYLESAILGSILGAVSPAVVVPLMIDFMDRKKGTEKGIPTLVLAASSIDDVFVIVIYSVLIGFYTGSKLNIAWKMAGIPVSIISGIVTGLIIGFILYRLFDKFNPRATKRLLIILGISIVLVALEPSLEKFMPFAALLAVMAMGIIVLEKNEYMAHEISGKLAKLWVFAEILLFTLVGAQVNIHVALKAGLSGSILIGLALIARSIGTYLCLIGSSFTQAERMFIVISYIPKATVQAAIGGAPLLAMQAAGMNAGPGQIILAVAVLSILLTAPVGAWAISFVGDRVLKQEKTLTTTSAGSTSMTENDIAQSIRVDEVMESDIIVVRETQTLRDVFRAFSESDFIICPIINSDDHFAGIICMDDLRPLLLSHHTHEWLIAGDVCRTLQNIPKTDSFLDSSLRIMSDANLHEIPVIEPRTQKVVGLLNYEKTQRYIKEKWLEMNRGNLSNKPV